jgi:hypothetical protein
LSPLARLRQEYTTLFRYTVAFPEFHRFMRQEALTNNPGLKWVAEAVLAPLLGRLLPQIIEVQKQGLLPAVDPILFPWGRPPRGRAASIVRDDEALFLRCILQCQNDYGSRPIPELGLPRSIGVVVDYDYVKRMMFTKMLRDDDNTEEGRAKHRERTRSALKAARMRLMAMDVVGSSDPFIWWTGRPVRGIKETQKHDPSLFSPPLPTFAPE